MSPHSFLDTVCHAVDNLDDPADLEQVLSFVLKKLDRETLNPVPKDKEIKVGDVVKMKGGQGPLMVVAEIREALFGSDTMTVVEGIYWNERSHHFLTADVRLIALTKCPLNN